LERNKTIIDKISNCYGVDENLKLEFLEDDKMQLNNHQWGGRYLLKNNIIFEVLYTPEPFALSLRITMKKNK
jgi:hypothetical protein